MSLSKSNRIIAFIDYDNIQMNMKTEPPEKLAETLGYERLKSWLSEIGEVVAIFIFAPAVTISANIEFFYKLGFFPIACPMLPQEGEERKILYGIEADETEDTPLINKTDEVLVEVAKTIINLAIDITHICIASGDHHFVPIAKLAKNKGKKVILAISNHRPSRDLLSLADINEHGKIMIHMFNPIRD